MRTLGKVLLATVALGLAGSQAAHASGFSWNGTTKCGGNSFATCAAVSVNLSYNAGNGRTTVTMVVHNLSGTQGTYNGTVFTQIGLWNLPQGKGPKNPGAAYVNGSLVVTNQNNVNVTSAWQLGTNGLSGSGIQPGVFGVDPTQGINGGVTAGSTYTFTFEMTGLGSNFDMNTAGFALHGQGGYAGCSTKLVIGSDGTSNAGPYDPACSPPVTATPEPVTMTLLATGLAGMSGAGFLRRRKKQVVVS
jgi:hypothetical protein